MFSISRTESPALFAIVPARRETRKERGFSSSAISKYLSMIASTPTYACLIFASSRSRLSDKPPIRAPVKIKKPPQVARLIISSIVRAA